MWFFVEVIYVYGIIILVWLFVYVYWIVVSDVIIIYDNFDWFYCC